MNDLRWMMNALLLGYFVSLLNLSFAQDSTDCKNKFEIQKVARKTTVNTFPIVQFYLKGDFSEGSEAIISKLEENDLLVEIGFGYAMRMEQYYFAISDGIIKSVAFESYEFNVPPTSDSTSHIINRQYQCWTPDYQVDTQPSEAPIYPVSVFCEVLGMIREQHGEKDWRGLVRYLGIK